eukprot:Em0286g4a
MRVLKAEENSEAEPVVLLTQWLEVQFRNQMLLRNLYLMATDSDWLSTVVTWKRHIEQVAEYVIKCKWHPGTRGSETKIEGRFWGTQMSGANICKTLAAFLGPNADPAQNVPHAGEIYRYLFIGAAVDPNAPDVYKEAVNVFGDMNIRNLIVGAYQDGPHKIMAKIAGAHKNDVDMSVRDSRKLISCLNAGISGLISQQYGKTLASWPDKRGKKIKIRPPLLKTSKPVPTPVPTPSVSIAGSSTSEGDLIKRLMKEMKQLKKSVAQQSHSAPEKKEEKKEKVETEGEDTGLLIVDPSNPKHAKYVKALQDMAFEVNERDHEHQQESEHDKVLKSHLLADATVIVPTQEHISEEDKKHIREDVHVHTAIFEFEGERLDETDPVWQPAPTGLKRKYKRTVHTSCSR